MMFKFENDTVKGALAIFVPASYVAHVGMWTFFPPHVEQSTMTALMQLLGLHGGWVAMIIGYYFNSSASSARKDEIIAASAPLTK
jgi:hypothetical protein